MPTQEITDTDYLKQRLDEQISWFGSKSTWNQTWFKRLRMLEIVAAALIPFLSGNVAKAPDCLPWFIGGLGVLIAVSSAIANLLHFQENWIRYRATAERLTREKLLYQTRSTPYDGNDPFHTLVVNVEAILAQENGTWVQQTSVKDSKAPAPPSQEKKAE